MYWLNVQWLRVKVFVVRCCVVCCFLFRLCARVRETSEKHNLVFVCLWVCFLVCPEIEVQQHFGDITADMDKRS